MGTACNVLNVETNMDSSVNVETENGRVHVETQRNNQYPSHVGTTVDRPVMLHVHVETPNIVNLNTESVEPANTQGPVCQGIMWIHRSLSRPRPSHKANSHSH